MNEPQIVNLSIFLRKYSFLRFGSFEMQQLFFASNSYILETNTQTSFNDAIGCFQQRNFNQMDDIVLAETSGRGQLLINKQLVKEVTFQSDIYEISGNSYTIIEHHRKLYDAREYKYLKINIIGNCTKSFSYGCFYFLITTIILFFFPLFLLCCDCCKRKIYNLFNVKHQAYEAVGQIIAQIRPKQCYLVVQDSYFNDAKCNAIGRGLEQSHTTKFEMVNISQGINTYGHNYSDFPLYCKQLKQIVPKIKCRWGSHTV